MDLANGRLVKLFVHCLADATTQRRVLIDKSEPFLCNRIVVRCHADPDTLVGQIKSQGLKLRRVRC